METKISHIKLIEITWGKITAERVNESGVDRIQASSRDYDIFKHEIKDNTNDDATLSENIISINGTIMKCTNCVLSMRSVGILYRKLIDWFQEIEKVQSINSQSLKGYAVQVYPKCKKKM